MYYYANKDSELFIDLARIYWNITLKDSGLINYIAQETLTPVIILYGSLSKAEVKPNSDIDVAIFTVTKKELNIEQYEKKLKRKIQLMIFNDIGSPSKELLNNILNGYKLEGSW